MTTEDRVVPGETEAPPDDEEEESGSGQEAPPQPTAREVELERRLRRQGQELADLRRTTETQLTSINANVRLLGEHLSSQQKADEERRAREVQAYLESLPEGQRLKEEVRLANERVARMERMLSTRNDAQSARTSESPPPTRTTEESPEDYFRRRSKEILAEAQETFGVDITRDDLESLEESDWDDEKSFHRAVHRIAAQKESGVVKPAKKSSTKAETPEEMEARITSNVQRSLGISSPNSPKAAASQRRGAPPTEDDVRAAASTYDSRKGPKASVARLRELRERMPEPT